MIHPSFTVFLLKLPGIVTGFRAIVRLFNLGNISGKGDRTLGACDFVSACGIALQGTICGAKLNPGAPDFEQLLADLAGESRLEFSHCYFFFHSAMNVLTLVRLSA